MDLDVLDASTARELFETVIGATRVAAEPEATAHVLACCAGLPLALRIAAARLVGRRAWDVSTLADRLLDERRRLDELSVDDIAIRTSFRASYDNLPRPSESGIAPARVFRLLGLSPMSEISLSAAVSLVGAPTDRVEESLELLVDACLLTSPVPGRYRFHDLLRVFATERASIQEDSAAQRQATRRLASWYLANAVAADKVLRPHTRRPETANLELQPAQAFEGYAQALEWFEAERSALPVVTAMAASREFHDIAAVFPTIIQGYLNLGAHWQTAIFCGETGLASARARGDRVLEAHLLNGLGIATGRSRQLEAAAAHLTSSVTIRRELGDHVGELSGLINLGNVLKDQRRLGESKEHTLRALALARALGRRSAEAHALNNLGILAADIGAVEEAIDYQEQCLAISRELGDAADEAAALLNLGEIHERDGRFDEALSYLQSALPLAHASGDRPTEATVLTDLGQIMLKIDRTDQARGYLTDAEMLWRSWDPEEAVRIRTLLSSLAPGH
nr:tetratricopeptide repeat protein [Streptomyces sp. 846.5]